MKLCPRRLFFPIIPLKSPRFMILKFQGVFEEFVLFKQMHRNSQPKLPLLLLFYDPDPLVY